jgi:ABC-type branched-subunit amino acid transport system substrate-binding protein
MGLAGCATQTRLRQPADAYTIKPGFITREMLAESAEYMKETPQSADAARGAFILVRYASDTNQVADMDTNLQWLEKNQPSSPWMAPAVMRRIQVAMTDEGSLPLLNRINNAMLRFPNDPDLASGCQALIPKALSAAPRSDLETFVASAPAGSPVLPGAMLTLGKLRQAKGENEDATRVLRRLTGEFPEAPQTKEAFAILRELSKEFPVESRNIGAILPVTGRYSAYGTSVMNGIQMAVEDLESSGNKFNFMVEDVSESPEDAVSALDRMFKEKRAIALFGPLFSATALAAAAEANSLGLVMMTPSALTSRLTATGPYVFRVSMTPEKQAQAMAKFAVIKRGFRRFGILCPDNAYGRNMAAAFTNEVLSLGATVLAESRYQPQTADFSEAIVGLGGADITGTNEMEEEFKREYQGELEVFLQAFFKAAAGTSYIPLAVTATGDLSAPPPETRAACLVMTPDPFSNELSVRLHAAALAHKKINILSPESATSFSSRLKWAEVESSGPLSGPAELALGELLGQQATLRNAPLAVLISVQLKGDNTRYENLECSLAMYDSNTSKLLATHRFTAKRALPAKGNRQGIEAIYLPAPGSHVVKICPQLVYHEMKLPLLGSDSWDEVELTRKPEAIGGEAYFTVGFWADLDRPATRRFVQRYQDRYAAPPDTLAAHAYDGARILMEAVLRSDGSREGLREQLSAFGPFDGASGEFRMGSNREPEKEAVILMIGKENIAPAP